MYPAFGIKPTLSPKIYLPFFTGLDLFAMGVLIAGLYAMGLITKSWARIGSIGLLLIFVVLPVGVYTRGEFIESIRKIVFGCTLFLVADAECLAARILCNPLLRWFGIISYEWYLFHQPIFIWFKKTFGPANGSISVYMLIVGGSFMTSLFLAALVYKYFSLPILKYGRSR
jgi:peptidoglycan/LPS O-acetylase OafA/YrhL